MILSRLFTEATLFNMTFQGATIMRVCKPNETELIFGQGSPSMMNWSGFAATSPTEKALGAAIPSTTPSAPSISPSVPSTINPTFSGQPAQTDPSQGLPAGLCGPSVAAGGSLLGGLFGGPFGGAIGAFIGTAARENFCPAPAPAPAAPTTVSEVSLDTGTIGVDFGPDTQSAGTGLGDAEAVA